MPHELDDGIRVSVRVKVKVACLTSWTTALMEGVLEVNGAATEASPGLTTGTEEGSSSACISSKAAMPCSRAEPPAFFLNWLPCLLAQRVSVGRVRERRERERKQRF